MIGTGFGAPHRHLRLTDSTNNRARELAEAGASHGTVVTAEEQSAGRGRLGRTWTAPRGKALLYSAIVTPLDERHLLLPLAVPIAVCEAAESLQEGLECAIKWPNDIWVAGRKLAGVLIEARPQEGWAVIGVGLNLAIAPQEFPPQLRQSATSLSLQGSAIRETARRELDAALDRWVIAEGEAILDEWRARDALCGRQISWEGGSGVADGVDETGRLIVLLAGGEPIALGAGEVSLRL